MNSTAIAKKAINKLESIFEAGKGLRSTPLKRYSGPALEGWTEYVVSLICETLQEQYPEARIEFDIEAPFIINAENKAQAIKEVVSYCMSKFNIPAEAVVFKSVKDESEKEEDNNQQNTEQDERG